MSMLLHIDCSEGVSIPSLLRALLSLNASSNNELSNEWIEQSILMIFPDVVEDLHCQSQEPFYRVRVRESTDLGELFHRLSFTNKDIKAQENRFQQRGRDFIETLMKSTEEHRGSWSPQHLESAILAICIFLWFDKHTVQNLSVSPIPVQSKQISEYPAIWTQFPVLLASTVPFVSNDAILVLRILLDLDRVVTGNQVNKSAAPSMVLTQQIIGEYHSPTPHLTTISVGTPTTATNASDLSSSLWETDQLYKLEANIDDCTAEHLAFCVDCLLTRGGAADAWVVPIVMKKGRAAHTVYCLCKESNRNTCLELLFRHSSTLGVRVNQLDRVALKRTIVTVKSNKWNSNDSTLLSHDVDVKIGYLGDQIVSVKAEFDHCMKIAKSMEIPIKTIADEAVELAKLQLNFYT